MILMDFFKKALAFAKDSVWKDDTKDEIILATAEKVFLELKPGCTRGRRLIWLTGQSGTGKTSQLLKATQIYCENHNIKPLHLAVRNFAHLHPLASKLAQDKDFREITNGFALKVLFYVLKRGLEAGLDILLEICFLDKCFEDFVLKNAQKLTYKISLQIMAVNSLISKALVYKRSKLTGRKTRNSSENYFYKSMAKGMRYISKKYRIPCTVWSINRLSPVFVGQSNHAYNIFKNERKKKKVISFDENKLLTAKINILEAVYQDDFS